MIIVTDSKNTEIWIAKKEFNYKKFIEWKKKIWILRLLF